MAYEKMPCLYETEKDLIDRLHGTVCRYKGVPVFVKVHSRIELKLTDLETGALLFVIAPNDPDFDISSAEIGYMNHEVSESLIKKGYPKQDGVYYIVRHPSRRYRQGLYSECLNAVSTEGIPLSPSSLIATRGFKDMISGIYPKGEKVIEEISKKKAVAVSREIALRRLDSGLVLVDCRKINIGWIEPNSECVSFKGSEFDWIYQKILHRNGIKTNLRRYG